VKVDPSSCTDFGSSYWKGDMPSFQNTEERGQKKANGTLLSSAASLAGQLPLTDKKRKTKDSSESGSQIYCGM
jgi:hypothetical protein